MLIQLRKRMGREEGFTLIELLVVMLILGILAAIAIPTFFNQREKAQDSDAKAMARAAQTAIETYATDHSGKYTGATVGALTTIEPTVLATGDNAVSLSPGSDRQRLHRHREEPRLGGYPHVQHHAFGRRIHVHLHSHRRRLSVRRLGRLGKPRLFLAMCRNEYRGGRALCPPSACSPTWKQNA